MHEHAFFRAIRPDVAYTREAIRERGADADPHLYLSVASWQFTSGELAVYQTLLEKPSGGPTALPLTRADLYA